MPWFESSKQKQLRLIVEQKMRQCLTRPQKYQQSLRILDSYTRASNISVIQMVIDHVKQTIKDQDVQPMRKYQAILMLSDLMKSHNKALGKYVVKKILKRLTVLAQHRKNSKDEDRGKDIFPKTKNKQQIYGAKFLTTLLLAIQDWGKNWPRSADGPFRDFQSAYNELIMGRIQFPAEAKKNISRQSLPKVINNSPTNQPTNQPTNKPTNRPTSRQIMEKKKQSVPKYIKDYLQKFVEALKTLISLIQQNPEFGDIWPIIQSVVSQIKNIIQQGDGIVAQLLSNEQENPQLLQRLDQNQIFLKDLQKDVGIVNTKNQKYPKFRDKYLRKGNQIIAVLSVHFADRSNSQSKIRDDSEQSKNQKKRSMKSQPKMQEVLPKIKQPNRFDSGSNLQQQMQLGHISIKKEDFNSNSHSDQNTSRYNSIGGRIQNEKANMSDQGKEDKIKKGQSQQKIDQSKFEEKSISIDKANKNANMSKISEKFVQSDQDFGAFPEPNKTESPSQIFNQFQIQQKEKHENSNSNSDFFKDIQQKQGNGGIVDNNMLKPRTRVPKKKPSPQTFFDASINNQGDSSEFSAFKKNQKSNIISAQRSQQEQQIKNKQIENSRQKQILFDTFKDPKSIAREVEVLKNKQSKKDQNLFRSKQYSGENQPDNPFGTNIKPSSQFSREYSNSDSNSKSSNPFSSKAESNPRSQVSKKSVKIELHNFAAEINKKIAKKQNPIDSQDQISKKSMQSQKSQDAPINDNPFEMSIISNPFDKTVQNQSFHDRSLSKNKSFNNAKIQVEHSKPNFDMNDPFETSQNINRSQQIHKNESFAHELSQRNKQEKINNFLRESIKGGFDFDDFDAVNQNSRSSNFIEKQSKPNNFSIPDLGHSSNFQNPRISQKSLEPQKKQLNFWDKNSDQSQSKKGSQKNIQKPQYDFNDFGSWDNKSNSVSQGQIPKKSGDMFGQGFSYAQSKKSQKKPTEQFGFSDFDKFQKDKSIRSSSSMKNPFQEKSKIQQNISVQQSGKNQQILYNWDNFGNQFQDKASENKKKLDNSQYQNSEQISNEIKIKQGQKVSSEENVEWEDFQKKEKFDGDQENNQSQLQQSRNNSKESLSENKMAMGSIFSPPGKISDQIGTTLRQQILANNKVFESPFQKKQQPWSYQLSPDSCSHINSSNKVHNILIPSNIDSILETKQKQVRVVNQHHKNKLQNLQVLKNKLYSLRSCYKQEIMEVSSAQQQRNQFKKILNLLKQSNQTKQKQILDLIKRTKKAEEIKSAILDKQKLLYQLVKQQKIQNGKKIQKYQNTVASTNKWQKFNKNIEKLRNNLDTVRTDKFNGLPNNQQYHESRQKMNY